MSVGLELLGWDTQIQCKGVRFSKKPFVGCLSHTAGKQEFLLWWLYNQNSTFLREKACLVMAGKDNTLFQRQPWKWALSQINIILLGDKRWEESQGYVQQIVDEVRKKKYRVLIIAPTGKDKEIRPWRSGYYHIGRILGWGFRVAGFDFETKRLKIGPYSAPGRSLEDTQKDLQFQMGDIVPLRVENSPVLIRKHDFTCVNLVDKQSILIPLALLVTVVILVLFLRKDAGRSVGDTVFHIIVSLYGLYLQTIDDVVLNCAGLTIIYQHIPVIYMGFPRIPETAVLYGALIGVIIGVNRGESSIYIPFLYSLLSKVPTYAKTLVDQCRVIAIVVVISIVLDKNKK